MTQDRSNHVAPDTTPIYRLIRRTRHLLRSSWVATGLGLTVGLLLGTLVGVVLLDLAVTLWPEADPVLRLTALLLIVVPATWAFFVGVVRPLFRRLAAVQVARRIESHIPGIHNRLVSCIDLDATREKNQRRSFAFYRRLVQEAVERIRGFQPGAVVDFLSLRRAAVFAAGSTLALILAIALFSDRLPTVMARILHPFEDIPPASGVKYTVDPGNAKVLRGDDIAFAATVEQGAPKELILELRGAASAKPIKHNLKPEGNVWKVTLNSSSLGDGFNDLFSYRVRGGGTWSRQYQVTLVERPVITGLHTVLHYPDYMGLEPRANDSHRSGLTAASDAADVSGPEESRIEVVVQAEGSVATGEVQFLEARPRRVEVKDRPEKVWFDEAVPPGATAEPAWLWDGKAHQRATHTDPPAVGVRRHWFQNAPPGFRAQPGEHLFTYVYLVPGKEPDALMVQWHDGSGWEHGAYWGADTIREGRPNTPGRRYMGPLPAAGKWERLEVLAELVNLQGKDLRGMSFIVSGGQCLWHKAGTLPPSHVIGQELVPVQSFPLQAQADNQWSGRFPLKGNGLYRVELRNELGHANKPMKEAKFFSFPDKPPHVVLKHPGEDRKLSKPEVMPLIVEAYDDFGLADVTLFVQRGDGGRFEAQTLQRFDTPQPGETVTLAKGLDLPAMSLKLGEQVRYRVEARDRKGQVARTPEFMVRIQADPAAADQQLAAFEKTEDPFREKLVKLIAEQAKVREAVEKMSAKYAPLDEKIKAAQAEARKNMPPNPAATDPTKPPPPSPQPAPVKLDPESEKALQELRKELAQLFPPEQQNVQLGQQIAGDLARMVEQANAAKLLPQIAAEKQALMDAFQQRALDPLQDLAARMQQGSNPQQTPPDLKEMKRISDQLQKELEALKSDAQALADARRQMQKDLEQGLTEHQREMRRQRGNMTARDLEELREFIAALRKELKNLEGQEDQLHQTTAKAPDALLPDLEKHQDLLEKEADPKLEDAKDLQSKEKQRKMKRRRTPKFPNAPYSPDGDEEIVRPKEEDTDEPDAKKAKDADKAGQGDKDKKAEKKDDEEKEDLYLPALGGPRPKEDPRFAGKKRPVERKAKAGKNDNDPASRREDLDARQAQKLQELSKAEQSLASDEESLEQMLQQLRDALRPGRPGKGQPKDSDNELSRAMRSPAFEEAMAMAARLRQLRAQAGRQQGQPTPQAQPRGQGVVGDLQGSPKGGVALESELNKLDPATRNVIMKMQPKMREELLQSMREEGPEGYRKFIKEYFQRLTEVKNPKNP
jgi:hypothetical protein